MKKLITTTGYGTTGSSVVTDLFKEFENVKSFGEYEFRWLFDIHGVRELEVALMELNNRQNSDYYIKMFIKYIHYISKSPVYAYYEKVFNKQFKKISMDFIENLIDVQWQGYWHQDVMNESLIKKFFYYLERFIQKKILNQKDSTAKFYKKNMYYSAPDKEKFLIKVKEYINKLISSINLREDCYVFDQLVPPENIDEFLKYFDNLKVIVVDRDPRDLYLLEKYEYQETWIPFEDVNKFIKWYKLIRLQKKSKEVLYVNFEDFIYKYEDTIEKVLNFTGVKKEWWKSPKKFFNPQISIQNTKKWLVYPQAKKEVELIEKELKEFLVDY